MNELSNQQNGAGDLKPLDLAMPVTDLPSRRSTCKIDALPKEVRTWVNEALRDGVKAIDIIQELTRRGFTGFNPMNISRYYHGNYRQWLQMQQHNEESQIRIETAINTLSTLKPEDLASLKNSNLVLAALQLNQALQSFNPQWLTDLLHDKPREYVRLVSALNEQSREQRFHDKFQWDKQKFHDLLELKKNTEPKLKPGGLTPEILAQIEEAAHLL